LATSKQAVLWRIGVETEQFKANDISGDGARFTGGRWNERGAPVVYTSSSIALAVLETLVHLSGITLPRNRYLIQITLPQQAFDDATVFNAKSHIGWDALPAGLASIEWDSRWLMGAKTLLASVPSIVVPEERNYLINPLHPDMKHVKATAIRQWAYDTRIRSS
jgi:RES domain-containing protein